jgi:hypothetical protein
MQYIDKIPVVTQFDDCLRRCETCQIAASNAADPESVTYIYRDPILNIPLESREGASDALSQALNVRSRESKRPIATRMGVPKTASDLKRHFMARKNDVGIPRQLTLMQLETKSLSMKPLPNTHLRLSIFRSNRSHYP